MHSQKCQQKQPTKAKAIVGGDVTTVLTYTTIFAAGFEVFISAARATPYLSRGRKKQKKSSDFFLVARESVAFAITLRIDPYNNFFVWLWNESLTPLQLETLFWGRNYLDLV